MYVAGASREVAYRERARRRVVREAAYRERARRRVVRRKLWREQASISVVGASALRVSVVNAAAASLGVLRTIVDHSAAAQPTGGGYGLKNGPTDARTAI